MATSGLDLPARVAGLQIAISRITSLSLASLNALDGLSPSALEGDRQIVSQATDFANLIVDLARGLGEEAEGIECDMPIAHGGEG